MAYPRARIVDLAADAERTLAELERLANKWDNDDLEDYSILTLAAIANAIATARLFVADVIDALPPR